MNSVVVIPAYNRPEMLATCLRRVEQASDYKNQCYNFVFDAGFDERNTDIVFSHWKNGLPLYSPGPAINPVRGQGNSANILMGLAYGLSAAEEIGADIVHLLEEDVWVAKDYFDAAERIHKQFKPWALSLCRNQHRSYEPIPDKSLIYFDNMYQSIGVSFPLDTVREILVHNTDEYLYDMSGYLRNQFPHSRFGGLFPEQDGLIQRIIEKNKYEVAYANIPRAFHAGFYSYHRAGEEPEGTLEEKIAQLEAMSEEEMNRRSVYKDIRFCNMNGYDVKEFYLE